MQSTTLYIIVADTSKKNAENNYLFLLTYIIILYKIDDGIEYLLSEGISIYQNSCCIFGHREICETQELKQTLYETIEMLIVKEKVSVFIFGSKSQFNTLCHKVVTELKEKYKYIKRVYIRTEYPEIDEQYYAYLLENYEETYFPKKIIGATKALYVKRNYEMIDHSQFCIVYYDQKYSPTDRRSGTRIALKYAMKCKRKIYAFPKGELIL